jgi:peptidoglycan-N-acetylglucosamine deacetylase
VIVTTSWDDGHPADDRLAALLAERGLRGTFYIPRRHPICGTIGADLVKRLHLAGVEIGAHTMTHPDLRRLDGRHVHDEADSSRKWLEDVTGTAVAMFSYPFGKHDSRVCGIVRDVGFDGARCLRYNALRAGDDRFRMGISVQAADASPLLVARTWLDVRGHAAVLVDWSARAKRTFDVALARNGIWHLWGHSWEIDRNDDWRRLEAVLDYVAHNAGVRYLTNQQALIDQ